MTIIEMILLGISLGCDAFTVSICKGLNSLQRERKKALIISLYFGIFQFIMPIIGYYLGNIFCEKIIYYNPYISTILLITIGFLMLKDEENQGITDNTHFKEMFFLAIATSIDALAIGISLSFLKVNLLISSFIIGIITFVMCYIGYYLGNFFNKKIGKYSNLLSGIILILLGIKIFLENLFK